MTTKEFDAAYAKLNPGQKQAVDTIEGPVMVVAGPGTGKTQVVSLRVAKILQSDAQMKPSNILCLTFSTSGATAMRERLRSLIGAAAYGVTVKNFHSFCNDLIAEHPLVFDDWSALEQISDVERYRLVNRIIDSLLPDLELVNRKDPYGRTGDIIGRMSQFKREGVTDATVLRGFADAYEQEMAGKSKEGTKVHEKNLLSARKFRDLVEIFLRYQEELKKSQRYDYEDMILYVIQALKEHDWLLLSLQERFQYVLVDEFQDTNGAQYQLVELLTTYENVKHEPNLFVVGDDDQAIYRFQGANLGNILAFRDRFPKAPVIPLTVSYRCSQPILDAAGALISQNSERLVGKVEGLEKHMTSPRTGTFASPKLVRIATDVAEPWVVADMVEERLQAGVAPTEIAVLVHTNAELESLYEVFQARGLPVHMAGKMDLLKHRSVQQFFCILKCIHSPRTNALLAAALACECFGCHPADIARLFAELRGENAPRNLLDALLAADTPSETRVPWEKPEELLRARNTLLDLHQKLPSRTIVETLEHALKETGLLGFVEDMHKERSKSQDPHSKEAGSWKLQVGLFSSGLQVSPLDFVALQQCFERLKYRAYEQPGFSLDVFLSDLEFYENPDYRELRLRYELPSLSEEGVQLMTAHQSKGLEFDVVILPNFRHGHWDKRRNPGGVSVPEELVFGWHKDQKDYEKNQDERRVAFVAMTRARNELLCTCPLRLTTGDKAKDISPSSFVAEARLAEGGQLEPKNSELLSTVLYPPIVISDAAERAFLLGRLKDYELSVTALNHFLENPQMFLQIDLLQMPQAKKSSLVYGNAVHDALRQWALSVQRGEPFGASQILGAFESYLTERELLTDAERANLLAQGKKDVTRYAEECLANAHPYIYKVEVPMHARVLDVPIKGKLDRIDLAGPESALATVIDYKTGKPKTENDILKEEDYHRQLVFYALLMAGAQPHLETQAYVLDFIGEREEHPVQRVFQISQEQQRDLSKVIADVWTKILALDFSPL